MVSPAGLALRLARQAGLIGLYAAHTGWGVAPFARWALRLGNLLQAGGTATRIGCFGPGPHVVWEATQRCNLRCVHCHAHGGEAETAGTLTSAEARTLIDQVAAEGIGTFVFSGGEPLLRPDILDLMAHARSRRLTVFLATNGVLIDADVARRLKRLRVGVVIGLDALDSSLHDALRGRQGAWEGAMRGLECCARLGLYFHLNVVACSGHLYEVARVIDYGARLGAYSFFVYRFVPVGRGEQAASLALTDEDSEALTRLLIDRQRRTAAIIIPVAHPEYWAALARQGGLVQRALGARLDALFPGCQAGRGIIYLKPDGEVWACPFLPEALGRVPEEPLGAVLARVEAQAPRSCPGGVCGEESLCAARLRAAATSPYFTAPL